MDASLSRASPRHAATSHGLRLPDFRLMLAWRTWEAPTGVAPMKFDLAPISCRLLVEGVCLAVLASSDWTRQLAACDARLSEKEEIW